MLKINNKNDTTSFQTDSLSGLIYGTKKQARVQLMEGAPVLFYLTTGI